MGTRLVHASLLLCAAMWGLVFIGVHELLPALSPAQMVTLRFVMISIAFGLMFVVFPALRVFPNSRSDWVRFGICAVLAVPGSQLAIVAGQRYLDPQLASLIVATSPVLTAIFAAIMLGERFSVLRGIGSVIAFLGVAFIVLFGTGDGPGIGPLTVTLPAVLAVITPISWALYTVMSRPLAAKYPPLSTVAVCLTLGTVLLLPFLPSAIGALPGLTGADWGWLIYLALGGSLLPYVIWFASLKVLPANRTAAYMYVIPVFAMLFSWLWLGQRPGAVALIGGAFVLIGVVLTQWRTDNPTAVPAPMFPVAPAAAEDR